MTPKIASRQEHPFSPHCPLTHTWPFWWPSPASGPFAAARARAAAAVAAASAAPVGAASPLSAAAALVLYSLGCQLLRALSVERAHVLSQQRPSALAFAAAQSPGLLLWGMPDFSTRCFDPKRCRTCVRCQEAPLLLLKLLSQVFLLLLLPPKDGEKIQQPQFPGLGLDSS